MVDKNGVNEVGQTNDLTEDGAPEEHDRLSPAEAAERLADSLTTVRTLLGTICRQLGTAMSDESSLA